MKMIDAHTHVSGGHPQIETLLNELDLKLLNVCVAHQSGTWRTYAEKYRGLSEKFPEHYCWCTTFDLPDFEDPNYTDGVIANLQHDFETGAVACKIWKNIGMEIKDPSGKFILMDHPAFDPIYDFLAKVGKPLLTHIAEPLACWEPLTEDNPHQEYYVRHPEWHMHGRKDIPSHSEIIAARDRVMGRRGELNVIGAHMGSLESNLRELTDRLERYPNFAIDTTRSYDMSLLNQEEVRRFFVTYQDRILFATDTVMRRSLDDMNQPEREETLQSMRRTWEMERAFHATDKEVEIEGHRVRGIALPPNVLEKVLHTNARNWYPGL